MPAMRKNVICSRETSWLLNMVSAVMIANDPNVNSPSSSEALEFALSSLDNAEAEYRDQSCELDYEAIMSPDISEFAAQCGLPGVHQNALHGRYTFSVSGANTVKSLLRKCGELTMKFAPYEVRPAYCIRLALRVSLLAEYAASIPNVPIPNVPITGQPDTENDSSDESDEDE